MKSNKKQLKRLAKDLSACWLIHLFRSICGTCSTI